MICVCACECVCNEKKKKGNMTLLFWIRKLSGFFFVCLFYLFKKFWGFFSTDRSLIYITHVEMSASCFFLMEDRQIFKKLLMKFWNVKWWSEPLACALPCTVLARKLIHKPSRSLVQHFVSGSYINILWNVKQLPYPFYYRPWSAVQLVP